MTADPTGGCAERCGGRSCAQCGPAARAAAIALEQAVNTGPTAEPERTNAAADGPPPPTARVELSVFGRSVTVEAPDTLTTVAEVAERLWERLETPAALPIGAAGFVMSDPDGDVPAESPLRIVGPYPDWQVRNAA